MSSAANKYLVTGGAGFIGSALVKALVDRGEDVRVLDNSFRGSSAKLGEYIHKVDFVEADIRDLDAVRKATEGVRHVCHLAAINGTKHFYEIPEQVLVVGMLGTYNALVAAQDAGVESFTFTSSSEVYQTPPMVPTPEAVPMCIPDPFNPRYSYGGGKLIGEILVANLGRDRFRTAIIRPHNVYGPDMGFEHVLPEFAMRMRRKVREAPDAEVIQFPIQGTGEETRAFCHIDDFVDGALRVIDEKAEESLYHVGTDEEVSMAHLAELVGASMDKKVELIHGPLQAGGTPRRCPDITKLRGLGYEPKIHIAEGVKSVTAWYAAKADEFDSAAG